MAMMNRTEAELILQALTGGAAPSDWSVPQFARDGWIFGRPDVPMGNLNVEKNGIFHPLPAVISVIDPRYYVPANMYQSINNAIDAVMDDHGNWYGIVEIPPGIHTLADEITLTGRNAHLRGVGSTGSEGVGGIGGAYHSGGGVTQLVAPATAGKRGIVYDNGNNAFDGPTLENLHIVGNATAAGGINIRRSNNYKLIRCASGGFSTGYDFWFEGAGIISGYGYMERLMGFGSKYGIKMTETSTMRFVGCYFSGNRNRNISTIAASKGVWGAYPDHGSSIFMGCAFQGYEDLIDVENDENSIFLGCRLEDWDNIAVKLTKSGSAGGRNLGFQWIGGSVNNSINGSVGDAFNLGSGVENSLVIGTNVAGYANLYVNNSGNLTNKRWLNGELDASLLISSSALIIPDGISEPPTSSGNAWIYVDSADGDLKIKYGDGTVKLIVVDT